MSLEVYHENGFLLFQCNPDKTAFDWKNPRNHLTLEAADILQSMGEMIGAWIPDDIIVIDFDKVDGNKTFQDIKKKYNIQFDITSKTFCVQTAGGGYHIFLKVNKKHKFVDGFKGEGIKLLTDFTYVITSGSPGYSVHPNVFDYSINKIPEEMLNWLNDMAKEKPIKLEKSESFIPLNLLSKILKKLDPRDFTGKNEWYDFMCACQVATGYTKDVKIELLEWSRGFNALSDDVIRATLDMFTEHGSVTVETFIKILRQHDISQYFIKKVLSFNMSVELYENMRDDGSQLPFPEPNYDEISDSKEANELFITAGNSVAATLLGYAIHNYIIYSAAEGKYFLFDGNRWVEFNDMFSIAYTVLIRLCKFMFVKKKGSDIASENFMKLVKAINKTHWKFDVLKELQCREGIFYNSIQWDSDKLKETLTTQDSVIDFTNNNIITRLGTRDEFRKSCVPYDTDEIISAGKPVKYNEFLKGLFPDPDTLFTARQSSSMFISGNAKKVFQVYHGGGDNGKSTWIEIEKELLGPKAHTYSTSLILSSKYGDDKLPSEVSEFIGKYVLFGSEVEKNRVLSLGKLKNFSGGDTIGARPLYQKEKTFRPTWQMILSVNDLPFFDATDRAFIGRLLVLPFEKTFVASEETKQALIDKGTPSELVDLIIDSDKLKSEIRVEFPAIINQKILDYVDLKNNYNGIIKQSEKCKIHKGTYISDNNDIENFILEMCFISVEKNYFTSSEDLTDAYKNYTGLGKITSSYVVRAIMKSRQEVVRHTNVIEREEPAPYDSRIKIKVKVQRRGLQNIKLKTVEEFEAGEDNVPF